MPNRDETENPPEFPIPGDLEDHSKDPEMGDPVEPANVDVNLTQEEIDHSDYKHGKK